jgi:hypothetical protein
MGASTQVDREGRDTGNTASRRNLQAGLLLSASSLVHGRCPSQGPILDLAIIADVVDNAPDAIASLKDEFCFIKSFRTAST